MTSTSNKRAGYNTSVYQQQHHEVYTTATASSTNTSDDETHATSRGNNSSFTIAAILGLHAAAGISRGDVTTIHKYIIKQHATETSPCRRHVVVGSSGTAQGDVTCSLQHSHHNIYTSSGGGVTSRGKRIRTIFTPEQLERLEAEFERQQYMVGPERLYLAHALQLTEAQVKVWFQNRRIKWRKHHLEVTQQRLALLRRNSSSSSSAAVVAALQHIDPAEDDTSDTFT